MTTDLSVVSEVEPSVSEVEPHRPVHGLAEILEGQLNGARQGLAHLCLVSMYDHTEIPGHTKGDFLRHGSDPRPATLYDSVFADVEGPKRPPRGEKLEVAITAVQHQVEALEAELAEQNALAKAHAAWARENGTEAVAAVTDPQTLQMIVGAQEACIRDLEGQVDELRTLVFPGQPMTELEPVVEAAA